MSTTSLTTISTTSPSTTKEEPINIFASLKTKKDQKIPTLSTKQQQHLSTLDTKSKMIRYLTKEGFTTHQISKVLNIKYQHVYNVQHTVPKS